jgi:predicted phage-related endonuclease
MPEIVKASHPMLAVVDEWQAYEGPEAEWNIGIPRRGPHERKKRGIGSYDATVILGESPYKSPLALYNEMVGNIPKPEAKWGELAEVGSLLEPVVAALYKARTGRMLIDRADYPEGKGTRWDTRRHPELKWMVANPDIEVLAIEKTKRACTKVVISKERVLERDEDGYPTKVERDDHIPTGNGLGEMKTKDGWGEFFDDDGNPPLDVQIQVQHQLAVTGLEWASIMVLMGRRFYYADFGRDDEFIEYMIGKELEFLRNTWKGIEPEADHKGATAEALSQKFVGNVREEEIVISPALAAKLHALDDAKAKIDALKEETDLLENLIKVEMADADRAATEDGEFRFSHKESKPGTPTWQIKGGRTPQEIEQLEAMGGVYKPGKKPVRTFRRLKAKKKKE